MTSCALTHFDCRGDLERVKILVENGVNCSVGDYDGRTVIFTLHF